MISKEAKYKYDIQYRKINKDHLKEVKKLWKEKNIVKVRKWKLEWALSEVGKMSAKKWRDKSDKNLMRLYIKSAEKRNLVFDISEELFIELIHDDCFYCGQTAFEKRNGIDRIDNTIGYSKDNLVPCCFKCNQMKGKLQLNEFLSHIVKILEYAIK